MRFFRTLTVLFAFLCAMPAIAHAQGAGIEWETLNKEVMDLYRAGKYDRAVVVAKKALQVAEENVGPDHSDDFLVKCLPHGLPPSSSASADATATCRST